MDTQQRYAGQSLERMQQFLDSHADVVGTLNTSDARKELDAAISKLTLTVTEQGARSRETLGESNNQRQLEGVLRTQHMTPISKLARARLEGVPNIKALTPAAGSIGGVALVQAARAMAAAAEGYTAVFVAAQFPPDFVAQLNTAADAVATSISTRSLQRVQRSGATTAVQSTLRAGRKAALSLDAAITRMIAGNDRLVEEWRLAKRVSPKKQPASPTVSGTPASGGGTPAGTPSTPAVSPSTPAVAPAATPPTAHAA